MNRNRIQMRTELVYVGFDPGLRHFGYAAIAQPIRRSVQTPGARARVLSAGTWVSTNENLKGSYGIEVRVRELSDFLQRFCLKHQPDFATIESLTCVRSSVASQKIGCSFAAVVAVLASVGIDTITQVTPRDLKMLVCNDASASKQDIEERLALSFGQLDLPTRKDERDHASDALALADIGRRSERGQKLLADRRRSG